MTEIQSATEKELLEIYEIEKLCFTPPWSMAQLETELCSQDAYFAVYNENGKVAGFSIIHMAGDQGELYQIGVHPDFRRQRIGKKLLESGFNWLYTKSAESVFLEVRKGNAPAIGLYEKAGFEVLGVRKILLTAC